MTKRLIVTSYRQFVERVKYFQQHDYTSYKIVQTEGITYKYTI